MGEWLDGWVNGVHAHSRITCSQRPLWLRDISIEAPW